MRDPELTDSADELRHRAPRRKPSQSHHAEKERNQRRSLVKEKAKKRKRDGENEAG